MITEIILNSEQDSKDFAEKLASQITKGTIITLTGDLGCGKTFLCREIIRSLCNQDITVISPTFNLLQIYQAPKFDIYHFDLYRLKQLNEIYELGIEEAFSENAVCLIEWPDIINSILPNKNVISIELSILNATTRIVKLSVT